jgi:hypothetical protein
MINWSPKLAHQLAPFTTTSTMPVTYHEIEERIGEAVAHIQKNPHSNISKIAREFDVPCQRLRYRLKTGKSKITENGQNKKLSPAEELALCHFLDRLDATGFPARIPFIKGFANDLLRRNHTDPTTDPPSVSHMWPQRFLDRHPEYSVRKLKPLAIERQKTHTIGDLEGHFERFKAAVAEYGILPDDLYNMDETGFRIGVGRAHKIVTRRNNKERLYLSDPNNRESITSIETICADGSEIPPLVILSMQTHLEGTFQNLNKKILMAVSDTGYSNDKINLEWIHHFNKFTKKKTKGVYRLLVSDGFESHNDFDFIQYSWDERIIPFHLPPHTTHLLQPLDVVCFQPLKHYHAETIDRAVRLGDSHFSRTEFLAAFDYIRSQTFQSKTIKSAFRKTGLFPYNPDEVLKDFHFKEEEESEDELKLPEVFNFNITPKKVSDLEEFGRKLYELIEDRSSPLRDAVCTYAKGTMARVYSGEQAEIDIALIQNAQRERATRGKSSRRSIQKGGVIYVEQARKRINARNQRDEDLEARKLTRADLAVRKRLFKVLEQCVARRREQIRRMKLQTEFGMEY